MTEQIPAVLHGAKSSPDEHGSIDDQIKKARAAAEAAGRTVDAEYSDEDASAYHRPRGSGLRAGR